MKIVTSWLHAATWPTCHKPLLFATFAPCWHGAKTIKKSTFWYPKIDILGVSVHILASWNAKMPIQSSQETKMPAFLVPAAKLPGLQVPGIWQYGIILYAREGIWTIWSLFLGWGERPKSSKIMIFGFVLPHSQNVTKVYYLLHLHHVGMVPKTSKDQHFGIPKSIFWDSQCTSWLPGVPQCPYRAAKKPRCRLSWHLGAKIPGFQVPGIWQYGVILYAREAIWTIWSLFPPFPRLGGNPKNHQKS